MDNIEYYINAFFNRRDVVFQQQEPSEWSKGKAVYARRDVYVDESLVSQHLDGLITISAPALSSTDTCQWLAFDSDNNDGQLGRVYTFLVEHGFNPLREGARPGRDGHLWLLLSEPVPGSVAVDFGSLVKEKLSVNLEFFPKQRATAKVAGGLRLPLGFNRKTDAQCRGWFQGVAQHVESQLEWLQGQERNRASEVTRWTLQNALARPPQPKSFIRPFKPVSILQNIPLSERTLGHDGNWITGCPSCIASGADNSRDNLRILDSDHSKYRCMRACSGSQIRSALR